MQEGRKDDDGKLRWSLLPWREVEDVVKVLEYGAKKYGDDNWKRVPDAVRRYQDALLRHVIEAAIHGDRNDAESGLSHLAHAVCCALFLMWFDKEAKNGIER